jgi:hypothetical protein
MIINIKLEDDAYSKTNKEISKIISWACKYHKKYFNIISGVDNCVLITNPEKTNVASWFIFDSLHTKGTIENLKLVMTDDALMSQLYKLTDKIKLECRIDAFDNTLFGVSPFFVFNKNDIEYFVVISRNSIDISVVSN